MNEQETRAQATDQPPLGKDRLEKTIKALGLIFWGAVLCWLDFTYTWTRSGEGFSIDLLNDVVGLALIIAGVDTLRRLPIRGWYRGALTFVEVTACLDMLRAIAAHDIGPWSEEAAVLFALIGIAASIGVAVFAVAMRRLAVVAELESSARLWTWALGLFAGIWVVLPLVLLAAGGLAPRPGELFSVHLGSESLLVVLVFGIPILQYLVSLWGMRREVRAKCLLGEVAPGGKGRLAG